MLVSKCTFAPGYFDAPKFYARPHFGVKGQFFAQCLWWCLCPGQDDDFLILTWIVNRRIMLLYRVESRDRTFASFWPVREWRRDSGMHGGDHEPARPTAGEGAWDGGGDALLAGETAAVRGTEAGRGQASGGGWGDAGIHWQIFYIVESLF